MTRREAREQAFLILFEWSFKEEDPVEEVLELAGQCRGAEVDKFTRALVEETTEYRIQIDHSIEQHSDKWKINRLSRTTLTALRMALCELTYMKDIPPAATINEAVELMKTYATEDEASYVNGVLGAYYRANQTEETVSAEEV